MAEVRKIRDAHAARFNCNIRAIAEDLRSREGKDGERVVSLKPKRVKAKQV